MNHAPDRVKMLYLHALTPVHSGTGQAVAVVDLPIAREKATGWPIIPASSLKGVLRDALKREGNEQWITLAFGKEVRGEEQGEAGILCFTDQRILCLAVRSYFGTFAYATCPLVLERLVRDMHALGVVPPFEAVPPITDEMNALVAPSSALTRNRKLYLEDLDLSAQEDKDTQRMAQSLAEKLFPEHALSFRERFVIVSDEVFNFLCETAIEVVARVRLKDETKTVEPGALWYEEAVPAESLFSGAVLIADHYRKSTAEIWTQFQPSLIQVGGDSTVGRGLCRVVIA